MVIFWCHCHLRVEEMAGRTILFQLSLTSTDLAGSMIRSPVQSLIISRLLGCHLPLLPGTQPCNVSFSMQYVSSFYAHNNSTSISCMCQQCLLNSQCRHAVSTRLFHGTLNTLLQHLDWKPQSASVLHYEQCTPHFHNYVAADHTSAITVVLS